MQTERVTFLTTPGHKAALDAFAMSNGQSVGQVVREATNRYIAEPPVRGEDEEALALLAPEVEIAVADMRATIQAMRENIARACAAVDAALADEKR